MNKLAQEIRRLRIRRGIGIIALTLAPGWALSANLENIEYQKQSDGSVTVLFHLDEPLVGQPGSFQIDNPARVAIDLPEVSNQTGSHRSEVDLSMIRSLTLADAGDKTRAVFNLSQSGPYEIKVRDNLVAVQFHEAKRPAKTDAGTPVSSPGDTPSATMDAGQEIDFRRTPAGAGRMLIRTGGTDVPMELERQGNNIIIDLPETRVEQGRYNVNDFATPVENVDVRRSGSGSRITLRTRNAGEHVAYQTGDRLIVEVNPIPDEQELAVGQKQYTGERLTLKFQDIELRPLLQLIADFTGNNIVVSDSVAGSISLRLENVPWDQAMDLILTTKGLDMRKNGNVMYVAPIEEITRRDEATLAARQQAERVAPIVTDIIQVNYARAEEIADLVLQSSGRGGSEEQRAQTDDAERGTFLSSRGSVTVDSRTNTLIVTDTGESLERVRGLIERIDRPVKQVLIETRIVIATDNFSRNLGVRWGVNAVGQAGGNTIGIGGRANNASDMAQNVWSGNAADPSGDFLINAPIGGDTDPTGTLGLAILGSNVLLNLELQAMQSEGSGEIVSNPKVITTNGHEAVIRQGTEIPYQTQSDQTGPTIEFKEALLETLVTPQITPNNNVILDINVKKDEPDWTRAKSDGSEPPIDTREVSTKVQVENGQTVVLGGIYEYENTVQSDKVPFFGDLPALGNLFRNRSNRNSRFELLIFVTPKILDAEHGFVDTNF